MFITRHPPNANIANLIKAAYNRTLPQSCPQYIPTDLISSQNKIHYCPLLTLIPFFITNLYYEIMSFWEEEKNVIMILEKVTTKHYEGNLT